MSYTKTTWQTGDTITATKLNKIEDQVAANEEAISASSGGGIEFITIDGRTYTCDKTYDEIVALFQAGKTVMAKYSDEDIVGDILPVIYGRGEVEARQLIKGTNNVVFTNIKIAPSGVTKTVDLMVNSN